MLDFDADTVARITVTVTLDFNPTGSIIELKVGSVWHDAVWLGTPVECENGEWKQDAQTLEYFAGPDVSALMFGTVQFSESRYRTKTRVKVGDNLIAWDSTQIQIV